MEATHKITGDFPLVLMAMGFIYALLDEKEKAREIISKFEGAMKENPEVNFDFAIALISLHIGDIEKFHSTYDSGISKHQLWLLQFYGTIMVKPAWYDEHVISSRKKLGLPVKSRNNDQ